MEDFRALILQQVERYRRSQLPNHGPTQPAGMIATPDAQAYAPFASTFGTVSSLFLVNGPVCLALHDAAENMGADAQNPHSATARAAQALVQSGTRKASLLRASSTDEAGDRDGSNDDSSDGEPSCPLQSVRAMAQRAFSVASSAFDAVTPSAGIVMDPVSGLPIAIMGSSAWMKLAGENADEVGRDISSSGTMPARIMWMPRQQALEMSAAKGSAEAQNELARQASKATDKIPIGLTGQYRGRSTASMGAAASRQGSEFTRDAAVQQSRRDNAPGSGTKIIQRPVDHPASPIMLDCMYALLRQARGETKRAISVTHSFLPVASGLPIPARLTIEFVSFKTQGNFPVVMVRGDTSPLASPLDQLLPDATSFHLRALGASRAQLSYAAGLLTGHRQATLPRAGISAAGVRLHPALAAFMKHLRPGLVHSGAQVHHLEDRDHSVAGSSDRELQPNNCTRVNGSQLQQAASALQMRGTKRPRSSEASSADAAGSGASQRAVDGEFDAESQSCAKRTAGVFVQGAPARMAALSRMLDLPAEATAGGGEAGVPLGSAAAQG